MHCPSCNSPIEADTPRCPTCGWLVHHQLRKGTQLQQGKYTVGKVLGQGGFGITYLGANTLLRLPVAIKELFLEGSGRGTDQQVISGHHMHVSEEKQRFIQEGKTLAQFNHPSIVRVLDVFEENNTCYLVMEHLTGMTLAEKISASAALKSDEVLKITLQVTDALHVVHQAGMLHRDIKPDNILVTDTGRVVLIDFGTARHFETNKTSNHTRMVTPGYAPLEQYATAAKAGPYTDLYALGATLYHALLGVPPPPAVDRLTGSELSRLPLPASHPLRDVIAQTLQLQIKDRPQNVEALRLLLQTAAELYQQFTALHQHNEPEAKGVLELAAQRGHPAAQYHLGCQHQTAGKHTQAAHWLLRAARQDHPEAQHAIALAYEKGQGVSKDASTAEKWFTRAAALGHEPSRKKLQNKPKIQSKGQQEALTDHTPAFKTRMIR